MLRPTEFIFSIRMAEIPRLARLDHAALELTLDPLSPLAGSTTMAADEP
jgi:hypothetical protein